MILIVSKQGIGDKHENWHKRIAMQEWTKYKINGSNGFDVHNSEYE